MLTNGTSQEKTLEYITLKPRANHDQGKLFALCNSGDDRMTVLQSMEHHSREVLGLFKCQSIPLLSFY